MSELVLHMRQAVFPTDTHSAVHNPAPVHALLVFNRTMSSVTVS